jgi:hypothetical protein
MRHILVTTTCDVDDCDHDANAVTVALDGARPLVVDLCPSHDADLTGPLRELLAVAGVNPDAVADGTPVYRPSGRKPKHDNPPLRCPECGELCGTTTSGVQSHARRHHGVTLAQLFYPSSRTSDAPLPCPVCGDRFATGTGVGAHAVRTHAVPSVQGLAALWQMGVDAGDPHGVVAARQPITSQAVAA